MKRAAEISKFDLVTHMIYEFPELQGIMGEKYARMLGEDEAVAAAVNEHYMPRSAGGETPSTFTGAVVAMADKLAFIQSICLFYLYLFSSFFRILDTNRVPIRGQGTLHFIKKYVLIALL